MSHDASTGQQSARAVAGGYWIGSLHTSTIAPLTIHDTGVLATGLASPRTPSRLGPRPLAAAHATAHTSLRRPRRRGIRNSKITTSSSWVHKWYIYIMQSSGCVRPVSRSTRHGSRCHDTTRRRLRPASVGHYGIQVQTALLRGVRARVLSAAAHARASGQHTLKARRFTAVGKMAMVWIGATRTSSIEVASIRPCCL